ncbi:hypothetical protein KP509_33G062800 [Ceratopteris richardii]|uniref:Vacuolar fusion protein MON1 homolog n=1 Tax=Ceratopteris richardii TaxID=49495 RepID=A0A8T2QQG2_CERRI|nr:hypothetical protein KP509_33G062800 [Ceratopteris richardii]
MRESDPSDKELNSENNDLQTENPGSQDVSFAYQQTFDAKQADDGPCSLPSHLSEKELDNNGSSTCDNGVNIESADAQREATGLTTFEFPVPEEGPQTYVKKVKSELEGASDGNQTEYNSDGIEEPDPGDTNANAEHRECSPRVANAQFNSQDKSDPKGNEILEQRDTVVNRSLTAFSSTCNIEPVESSIIRVQSAVENGNMEGHRPYADSEGKIASLSAVDGVAASSNGRESFEEIEVVDSGLVKNGGLLKRDLFLEKQHQSEDDSSESWRKHKKHFFILSHAGKPIYSRYGDEHKLAGFAATLQAIMSFVENGGDRINYVRSGDHQVVFLVKGPVYLVSISSTNEPLRVLRRQLDLLHGQLLLILTRSLEKCFVKNANFDLRPLLGGTENVFSSLIHSFSWNFASFLSSYTCLPLSHTARQAAGAALQDIADKNLLFALLLSDSKVISLVGAQKASLHPDDIFLLSNFVSSSESFRNTESFSPICLPKYNSMTFLYAYIRYLDPDICLILITKNSDAFFHLKDCRARIEGFLMETHVLRDISNSVARGGLRVEELPGGDVSYTSAPRSRRMGDTKDSTITVKLKAGVGGTAGLWHFIYRCVYLDQYVASEFSSPLETPQAKKRLFRAYQSLYASIHGAPTGAHQMQYRRDGNFVLLAWSTSDFEFLAAFDPLAEKSSSITVCNRVCQWVRDMENDLFFIGGSPFNW